MSVRHFTLVGGGARSGKSSFAQRLAESRGRRRVFLATAIGFDDEMRARIAQHVDERGSAFETIEAPSDLDFAVARLAETRGTEIDVVLVDCLTLWLSNLLLDGVNASVIERRAESLASALAGAPFESIVVTNEVGMGLVPETPLGRTFRDVTGRAHQRLARRANELYFATMGVVVRLKPGPVSLADDGLAL